MRGPKQTNINTFKKEDVNNNLSQVLMYYGCIPGNSHRDNWSCAPNRHNNPKGDLSIKGDVCCCHCGMSGDAINVISIMEGYGKDKEGFYNSLKKGYEILNMNIEIPEKYKTKKIEKDPVKKDVDLTKYINEKLLEVTRKDLYYFFSRGIFEKTLKKVKPIVSTCLFLPHENIPQFDNIYDYRYIIPIYKHGKVVNCLLRRDDKRSKHNAKCINLKNVPVEFLNGDLLEDSNNNIICITEGFFDTLSFMNYGIDSICLNSTTNVKKFIKKLESKSIFKNLKNKVFVLALDNDKAGSEAKAKLKEWFKNNGVKFCPLRINKDYKDINDYLVADKEGFERSIYKMMEYCEKML